MTSSSARRVHPQTTTVQLESEAFEIVAETVLGVEDIDLAEHFDRESDQCFEATITLAWRLERQHPQMAPELRLIRDLTRQGLVKDELGDERAIAANRERLKRIGGHGRNQIEILEPMLGARPTRQALGSCAGVDGWDGGA